MAVGHPHLYFGKILLRPIYVGIALRLCKMKRHRFLPFHRISVGSLDLIDDYTILHLNNAVSPSLQRQEILFLLKGHFQCNLRLVLRAHSLLDHAMNPAAFLHGIICTGMMPVIYIAMPQHKFHQSAHRNANFSLHALSSRKKSTPYEDSTLSIVGSQFCFDLSAGYRILLKEFFQIRIISVINYSQWHSEIKSIHTQK